MIKQNTALLILLGALASPGWTTAPEITTSLPERDTDDLPAKLEVGSVVPANLTLRDFEGRATSFKDLRGKTIILHFWSDRCPAERHANPIFKSMEERYAASKDVVMLGIASNQNELGAEPGKDADYSEHYTDLRTQRDKVGYKHTILADHGNRLSTMFQARSTPHCFVIDKQGVIRYAGALDNDPRGRKGEEAINYLTRAASSILAGEPVEVTATKPYG